MGVQLAGANFASRDDTGQQISLTVQLNGLLLPTTDESSFADAPVDSNPMVVTPWSDFELITHKNIFDPTRTGSYHVSRGPKPVVVHSFTLCGLEDDYTAVFKGEGTSEKGYFRVGESIDGFMIRQINLNTGVKLTDPSGNIQELKMDESMRRVENGPWTKSDEPAPESPSSAAATSTTESSGSVSSVSATPAGPASDILAILKKRKEEEK